jgi:hypothetical protein
VEAIQTVSADKVWIASALALLAMTAERLFDIRIAEQP